MLRTPNHFSGIIASKRLTRECELARRSQQQRSDISAAREIRVLQIAASLTLGITFSALARNQLQAMQMTFFFFLLWKLLSGFMFPFRGMPDRAQVIGNVLPLTHFLLLARGIQRKGNGIYELWPQVWPILLFMVVVPALGLRVYKPTLD